MARRHDPEFNPLDAFDENYRINERIQLGESACMNLESFALALREWTQTLHGLCLCLAGIRTIVR